MVFKTLKYLAISALILPLSLPALAAEKDSPWQGGASLSYIIQNGNSKSRAVHGKASLSYDWTKWKVGAKAEGGSTRTYDDDVHEMERTAEKYYGELREERKLTDNDYLYHLTTYLNDNFSGYDYQLMDSIGYGRRLIDSDTQNLDIEIGPAYKQKKLRYPEPGEDDKTESAALHLGLKYGWQITDSTKFTEDAQDDVAKEGGYTVRAETALTTMLNSHLAFSLSHLLTYNSEVVEGSHKTDTQFMVSLTYKLN